MRNLAPDNMDSDILQTLWLQYLPSKLQQILSVCDVSVDKLAQIVDKINEVSGCNLTVARVVSISEDVELDDITAELADLKKYGKEIVCFWIFTLPI
ncbi:hypothetical protein AVEN_15008-1 [Araneus ventricosus]|uniref:Uncharacterized protein n=1 Tax=Araneus ventricosus TaxID=182803 RepID=A0A4Y2FTK1_ARAVE|nr:hypothetical protein AVEN_15008-1 [Araneus ventricosus]